MKNAAIEAINLFIKKKQLKTSPVIVDVYNALADVDGYITAEDLWLLMVKKQKVSLASVYNYLRLLSENGFIEKASDSSVKNLFRIGVSQAG